MRNKRRPAKRFFSFFVATIMVLTLASSFMALAAGESIAINPVNNVNPMKYTVNGGPGSPMFRNFFRENTANTFLRPGESVTYNAMVDSVMVAGNAVDWSITGGVGATAISGDGKLTVDTAQPAGDIIVKAAVGEVSTTAKVTVRIVTDAKGYDQHAKWSAESFKLSEVTLDNSLWTQNRDIMFRYLLQGNREEKHLKYFYDTAGITQLPVAINGKTAGSNVSALTAPDSWDGIGYATTSRVWQRHLAGHGTGHYLSALSQAYQVTPNAAQKETFLNKMKLMVDQLGYVQDTNIQKGSYMYGFLSAYSEHQFDVLEEDKGSTPTTGETNGRSAWALYYTQHKIMQGLLDIYKVLKDTADDSTSQRALDIASKMGDWTYLRLSRWTQADRESMWNVYSAGEVGGIGQPVEELFFITGDELYRETAAFFEHNNNWNRSGTTGTTTMGTGATNGLELTPGTVRATTRSGDAFYAHFAKGGDGSVLNGKHANTIIPMIISALREYEADTPLDNTRINPVGFTPVATHYYDIAKNFFHHVYTARMSPIGGTAHGESWPNNNTLSWATIMNTGGGSSNEACTTINIMSLAASLFKHEQQAKYFDYYERALINHIMPTLAQYDSGTTQPPTRIGIDYLFFMGTNAARSHARYGDGSCCNSSGMESHTRYQEQVYARTKDGKGLYVNLYMPTTLNWAEKGFQIVQETDYLNEGKSKLTVNGNGPLNIMLRVPYWVEKGFEVKVNGEVVVANAAKSSYVTLSRTWAVGDVIEINMPFSVRIERSPENTTNTTVALFYGPIMMVQKPGVAARPAITGLNFSDLDSSFTKVTGPTNTHSFGNYTAFRLTNGTQNFDPMYTATTWNTTYCANFTVARDDDNVSVDFSVVGDGGIISANSYNRAVTDGQRVNRGSIVTFTAAPDVGYKIKGWKVNGLTVGGNQSNAYTLTGIASDTVASVEIVPKTEFFLNELEPNATLKAVTTIEEENVSGCVYMAMYDADGHFIRLVDSAKFSTNSDTGKVDVTTNLTLPSDVTGVTVKVFVWDDNLVPIRAAAVFSIGP